MIARRWNHGPRAAAAGVLVAMLLMVSPFSGAGAQSAAGATVTGLVIDAKSALPIPGASVVIGHDDATVASGKTDGSGRYTLAGVAPGVYSVTIAARGYAPSGSDDVAIGASGTQTLNAALTAASTATERPLPVIGAVSASSSALGAATTNTQSIDTQDVTATGQIRLVDAISTLPAVNYSTSSSVADDTSIDLRGFGVGETAVLLDGHPVGPLGAGLTGSNGAFDWSLGPSFGLSKVAVTYGSGAQGLFGSDTIGGAVDMITLNPTRTMQGTFQQQLGGFGIASTAVTGTGTIGKLGFAFAGARLGEYGDFYPGLIAQSARPDNVSPDSAIPNGACSGLKTPTPDVSACNLAVNTYTVSQNTMQTMGLAKLDYAFSPATDVRLTAYDGVQWSDSTGNGDNDFLPYDVRLGQINANPTNCVTGGGQAGYAVTTNPIPTPPTQGCYTASQFAAATSGPDGGGAGRDRGVQLRDYSLLAHTQAGANNFTFSYFVDNYSRWKNSAEAGGQDAEGIDLGSPSYAFFYRTNGFIASDELLLGRNDVSFGYSSWRQYQAGIEADFSCFCNEITPDDFGENSFFARDNYSISSRVSAFVNAWVKHSSVTDKTTFDPRATLQYRPTSSDVVQLTYGHSDGAPSPQLQEVNTPNISDPGSSLTTVTCGLGSNGVASAGNPALQSEAANDFELGLGHRTGFDSNVQLNAYVTAVQNQLFSGLEPLTQYGINNVKFAPNALLTYQKVLDTFCGQTISLAQVPSYLGVTTEYNAAHALARGVELTGRQHVTRRIYVDYGYDIESSVQSGLSNALLASNANVLNGAQVMGVPLHTATLSGDYSEGPWELHLDNYYTEFNNGLDRPSYWHSNAYVSRQVGKTTTLTLGGTNVFDSAVQVYGYIGKGTLFPQNAQSIPNGVIGPSEEFGLAPPQLTFTVQVKL